MRGLVGVNEQQVVVLLNLQGVILPPFDQVTQLARRQALPDLRFAFRQEVALPLHGSLRPSFPFLLPAFPQSGCAIENNEVYAEEKQSRKERPNINGDDASHQRRDGKVRGIHGVILFMHHAVRPRLRLQFYPRFSSEARTYCGVKAHEGRTRTRTEREKPDEAETPPKVFIFALLRQDRRQAKYGTPLH